MIPPSSKSILVNNLAAGTNYDLCVLAIYDDQVTALTATRVIGCIHFATEPQYLRCHFMQSQFLGGTIVVVIGGIIVASVLAFIIFLIVRYRVCNQGDADKVSSVCICCVLCLLIHYVDPEKHSKYKVITQLGAVFLSAHGEIVAFSLRNFLLVKQIKHVLSLFCSLSFLFRL